MTKRFPKKNKDQKIGSKRLRLGSVDDEEEKDENDGGNEEDEADGDEEEVEEVEGEVDVEVDEEGVRGQVLRGEVGANRLHEEQLDLDEPILDGEFKSGADREARRILEVAKGKKVEVGMTLQ